METGRALGIRSTDGQAGRDTDTEIAAPPAAVSRGPSSDPSPAPADSAAGTDAKEGTGKLLSGEENSPSFSGDDGLFPPDVHERYLELSRRPKATVCDCCGAEAAESARRLQVCSTCHRRAYCSAACQRQDWKEGGHKLSCRPRKDFREHDVVVAQGVEDEPELNGELMVVVGPAPDGRWMVMDARRHMNLHADKLRLVVPVEEREG